MTEEVTAKKPEESEFDKLMDAWNADNDKKEAAPQEQKVNSDDVTVPKSVVDYVEGQRIKDEKGSQDAAISNAVSIMKADEKLKGITDPFLEGYLGYYAGKNSDFMDAFQNREVNPSKWTQAMDLVKASAINEATLMPDSKLTKGMESAKAAAQGTTGDQTDSDDPDGRKLAARIDKMSDEEFRQLKAEQEPV